MSCQALEEEPLHGSSHMKAMARAAVMGGAAGIRANGPKDIRAIRKEVKVPIIGIYKIFTPGYEVFITPTLKEAREIVRAGADIVALDATPRSRRGHLSIGELIAAIKRELKVPVMADISNFDEAMEAGAFGADLIATTLSGYTAGTRSRKIPDFDLLRRMVRKLKTPVIMEGGIRIPEQARRAIRLGAHAVVVGAAITRPQVITKYFVSALKKG